MDIYKYHFHDVLISPHKYVYQHNTVPSILGACSLNNNYLAYYRNGMITSGKVATSRYENVIHDPCIIATNYDYHYGHFLLESLNRLYLIKQLPGDIPIVYVSCTKNNTTLRPYESEVLDLLNVHNPIYFLNSTALFKSVWACPPGLALDQFILPEQLKAYEIAASRPELGFKVYISRSKIANGQCENETELEKLLAARGWKICHPEDLDIKKQIEILAAAEKIFTISGSALHNMIFLHDIKARMIVIPRIHTATYNALASLKCKDYWLLNIERHITAKGSAATKDEFTLNIGAIRRILEDSSDFERLEPIEKYLTKPTQVSQAFFSLPKVLATSQNNGKKSTNVVYNLFYKIIVTQGRDRNNNALKILAYLVKKNLIQEYMRPYIELLIARTYPALTEVFDIYWKSRNAPGNAEACKTNLANLDAMITEILQSYEPPCTPDRKNALVEIKRPVRMNLDEIGLQTGTDKSSAIHNYLHFYDELFAKYRDANFAFLEIGIYKGASIRMWESYFTQASIYAVDIVPNNEIFARATVLIGNAIDPSFMDPLLKMIKPFIIIEDASHNYSHQIKIFQQSFPYLRPGGYYVCEDLQVCFGRYRSLGYNDSKQDSATYFGQLALLSLNKGDPACHPGLENASTHQISLSKQIDYIIFKPHCVIIRKKII